MEINVLAILFGLFTSLSLRSERLQRVNYFDNLRLIKSFNDEIMHVLQIFLNSTISSHIWFSNLSHLLLWQNFLLKFKSKLFRKIIFVHMSSVCFLLLSCCFFTNTISNYSYFLLLCTMLTKYQWYSSWFFTNTIFVDKIPMKWMLIFYIDVFLHTHHGRHFNVCLLQLNSTKTM